MAELRITRTTRVKIYSGRQARGVQGLVGGDPGDNAFRLAVSALDAAEGGPLVKLQAVSLSPVTEFVVLPFTIDTDDIPEQQRAVRGVDYQIVDANGDTLEGDFFVIRVNQQRGDVFVKGLQDGAVDGNKSFNLRLVPTNGSQTTDGNLTAPLECFCTILDTTATALPRLSMAESAYTVEEPGEGETLDVEIGVRLSEESTNTVTADMIVTAVGAELGEDFTLPASSISIAPTELEGTFLVRIVGDDIPEGTEQISVRLDNPANAELTPGATAALITVLDTDVGGTFEVQFADQHQGVVQLQEGGAEVVLRVEMADGVAATQPVTVEWSLEEVNGSGVELGSQITTSTPSPIVIPANVPFAEIRLQAPENQIVDLNRPFLLSLDQVIGPASLGSQNQLDGTLVDTTVPLPIARWNSSTTLNVVEGTTAQKAIVLDRPAPNPITFDITRTGVGEDDLVIGSVTMPAQSTFLNIPFTAIADTETEIGEQAVFKINPTNQYAINDLADELTVNVQDLVTGATILEYKPMSPGELTLVDFVTGFDPRVASDPPKGTVDGVPAEFFPVDTGRADGLIYAWQGYALVDGQGGQSVLEINENGPPAGTSYMDDDLSDVEFELQTFCQNRTTQFAPHIARFADGVLVEENKSGHYVKEETWMLRPRLASEAGTEHEYCTQIMAFVLRTPQGIFFEIDHVNEGYENDPQRGHFDFDDDRDELDGLVHYDYLKLRVPSGMRPRFDVSQRCSAGPAFLVSPSVSGKKHRISPTRCWSHRFVIVPNTKTNEYADELLGTAGWAVAESGPLAYDQRRWVGAKKAPLPRWGPGYRHPTGATGALAVKRHSEDFVNRIERHIRGQQLLNAGGFSTFSEGIGGQSDGWFEPMMAEDSYVGGGQMIYLQHGWDFHPDTWRALMLWCRQMKQVNPGGLMDIATGKQLSVQDMAATNTFPPGEPNKYPFVHHALQGKEHLRCIWFVPLSRRPGADPAHEGFCKRPTNREWSVVPSVGIAESLKVEPIGPPVLDCDSVNAPNISAVRSYTECDMDHFVRVNQIFLSLAYLRNTASAKYWAKKHMLQVQRWFPHVDIKGVESLPTAGEQNPGTIIRNQNLTLVQPQLQSAIANGQNGLNQGGVLNAGGFGPEYSLWRGRGHAHVMRAAMGGKGLLADNDPHKNEMQSWYGAWNIAWGRIATSYGAADRNTNKSRDGSAASPPVGIYPQIIPYLQAGGGIDEALSWNNPVPFFSTGGEGWHTAYGGATFLDAHGVTGVPATFSLVERYLVDLPFAMTRVPPLGSRTPSRNQANQYLLITTGNDGQQDAVGTAPVEHPLVPGPQNTGLSGIADFRWLPLYASALQAMDENSLISERDELLGYVKLHFNLNQAASLDSLINAIETATQSDSADHTARFVTSASADLLAIVQHLNR